MQRLVFYEDIIVLALNRIISFSFEASTKSARSLTAIPQRKFNTHKHQINNQYHSVHQDAVTRPSLRRGVMGVLKVRKKKKSSGKRVSVILGILLRSSSNRNIINGLEQYPPPC